MQNTNVQKQFIRRFMREKRLSPSALAKLAELHPNSLRNCDSATWNPTCLTVDKVIAAIETFLPRSSEVPQGETIPANLPQRNRIQP